MQYLVKQVKHKDKDKDKDILHTITKEQSDFIKDDRLINVRYTEKTILEVQKLSNEKI